NASNMRGVSVDGGGLSVFPEGKAKPTIKNSKNGPSRATRPTFATESQDKRTAADRFGKSALCQPRHNAALAV
ncbi:MAG TPA: hypothetical protein VNZ53_39535, partial [Steroidobacteraceae bacterium]|nr:hypothetical protein [Steroidobacteraceae bacterium]